MSNGIVTRLRGSSTYGNFGTVTHIRGRGAGNFGTVTHVRGTAGSFGQGIVTRLRGRSGSPTVPIYAGADMTLEPASIGVLEASAFPDNIGIVTVDWIQLSGPTVAIIGSGVLRNYYTPINRTGSTLTFQVTILFDNGITSVDSVTHTIYGHGGPWMVNSLGVLIPIPLNKPTI